MKAAWNDLRQTPISGSMKKKKNAVVNYENKSLCFSKVLDGASGLSSFDDFAWAKSYLLNWIFYFVVDLY